MAATKEAIAIVLDVGINMNQAPDGEETFLQTSINAINMILQRKMFSESKDEIALILVGTPDTANELADGQNYEHVSVARPLGVVTWDLLQHIQNDITPSDISADFLDGIVVGMDHIMRGIQGKRGFASKRIILFSDLSSKFADDNMEDIIGSMKEQEVNFNVIGPDLDDDNEEDEDKGGANAKVENGKEKSAQQRAGETLVRHIIEQVNGESYSFSEALPALSYFQSRQVRPTAWKCPLEIGDDLQIQLSGYIKTKEAKSKTFKNVYARDPEAAIQRLRTHHLNDEEETEIEPHDIVDGHRYGSTLVPFSQDDKEVMKFRAVKCLKLLCFTESENVCRADFLGDSCMAFVADQGDDAAAVALSALIQALYETNMVAIVRRVYSAAASPKVGVLTPHIKTNYQCLYYNELPFAEDVRQFVFAPLPLDNSESKHAPSEEQLKVMDELIDAMDLSVKKDDDEAEEPLKPKLTFNPYLQRLYQCLQHRALSPDEPLPELSPLVASYLKPPSETKSQSVIEKMKKLFKLEEVKQKDEATGENMFKDGENGVGVGGDAPAAKKIKKDDDLAGGMADLVKAKVTGVGTVNPIEDFRAIIAQKDRDHFDEACIMMQKRILQIVTDSFGGQFYGKAMDCLKALRTDSVQNKEPKPFNDFLHELKTSLKEKGRQDFWQKICNDGVTLVSKLESEDSSVSQQEATEFIKAPVAESQPESAPTQGAEDVEDLLGEM